MTFLHECYGIDIIGFSDRQVEVNLLFYIKKQHKANLDNSVKLILDCLQKEDRVYSQKSKMINNYRSIMKIVAEKCFIIPGQRLSTCTKILPLVAKTDF